MPIDGVSLINNAYRVLASQNGPHKLNIAPKASQKGEQLLSMLDGMAAVNAPLTKIKSHVLSEFGLEEFLSKNGEFKKGVAYMEGKLYSGIINARNGENQVLLEYSNGILRQSTRFRQNKQKQMVPVMKKIYSKKDSTKIIESYTLGDKTPQGTHRISEVTIKPDEVKVMKFGKDLNVTTSKRQKNGGWKTEHEKYVADKKRPTHIQQVKTNASGNKIISRDYTIRIT